METVIKNQNGIDVKITRPHDIWKASEVMEELAEKAKKAGDANARFYERQAEMIRDTFSQMHAMHYHFIESKNK